MKKELLINKSSTLCVNVVANRVESLRKVVETTSTVRVYEDGFVGIAGQIGADNLDALEKQAVENLSNKMPYPCKLTEGLKKREDTFKPVINPDNFVEVCRDLLDGLTAAQPDFLLNNKILYVENESSYENSEDTQLSYRGNELLIELTSKHKSTANLMDLFIGVEVNEYDKEKVIADYADMCAAFLKEADIEDGKYTVVADPSFFAGSALQHFFGELYAAQASLFKNKLGEKIFSDKLSVRMNKSETQLNTRFFDAEGDVAEGGLSYVVENGVLKKLLCNKKVAATFNLPRAECSAAAYDGLPSVGLNGFEIAPCDKNINELTGSGKVIYIIMASGGDMTSAGDFATPVQAAFLMENGKYVGKLPQLNAFGNINDYFGDDYIGATFDGYNRVKYQEFVAAKMNVSHIV